MAQQHFCETFSDVTLAVDGASAECHKIVLAACSPYFHKLLLENTCKHPLLFLEVTFLHIWFPKMLKLIIFYQGISVTQFKALLDFIYYGEVELEEGELEEFIKQAEDLQLKGLLDYKGTKEEVENGKKKIN